MGEETPHTTHHSPLTTHHSPTNTAIVGGGLAGLAAAAALADRGLSVALFESRPRLGGRASSIVDRETGSTIDNCQHVSMGCCVNFDHFCRTLGVFDLLETQPVLHFIGRDGVVNRFKASRWPAPLHLAGAFRSLSYLSKPQRKQVRNGLLALCRESRGQGISFADWLSRQRQSEEVIERFWHVVLVSALSETPERIDLDYARKVFVDGFLANREGWKVRIPTVPLDDFYGPRMNQWFAERNATIHTKAGVESLELNDDGITALRLRDGRRIEAEHVILAVPQHAVLGLLPAEIRDDPFFATFDRFETAPISSVHLWFDRPMTDLPHAVLIDRVSQWVFNRTRLQGGAADPYDGSPKPSRPAQVDGATGSEARTTGDGRHYYQVVISASRNLGGQSQQETIAAVVAELAEIWPETNAAKLLHSRMLTEHKAVFSPLPGVDALRPPQQTPIANLQLAGDWTATGWPATMEGAVRSGYLAAENVLRHFGRAERLSQADLPVAFLSRLLLRL